MTDLDLTQASTIPSDWYTDGNVFEKEMRHVFNRSWNLTGGLSQLEKTGSYLTSTAGRENFIVARDNEDKLRGLVNVCRHRAGPVASGCGVTKVFQCKYHGWIYDLQGKLIGTPEFQGVENFSREDHPLPAVHVEKLGPLIFSSLDPAVSFENFSGSLSVNLEKQFEKPAALKPFLEREYPVACNWKVYVDNYLEGYHLPLVHKGLAAELDYSEYRTETHSWYSEQIAPTKTQARLYRTDKGDTARYYWLFPNTMLNVYQGLVQTNVVVPLGKDQTIVKFVWYANAETVEVNRAAIEEMIKFSDEIQEEDRLICEQVQKNLNSVTYKSGRYSVKRENGVYHFHRLLEKMAMV